MRATRLVSAPACVLLLAVGAVPAALPARAEAASEGELQPVDLGTLGGASSEAVGVNDHGWIVGSAELASGVSHATLWRDGQAIDLGTLGAEGARSFATDVNNRGDVVGYTAAPGGNFQAFLWRQGEMVALTGTETDTLPFAINDRGEIAGYRRRGFTQFDAFVLRDGRISLLETPAGTTTSLAFDIDDRGVVVGQVCAPCRSVTWQDGRLQPALAVPVGFASAGLAAINEKGELAGSATSDDGSQTRAVRWTRGRPEVLASPTGGNAVGTSINARGTVAGYIETPDNLQAAVWDGPVGQALPPLVPGAFSLALDIGRHDEVVGTGATVAPFDEVHAVVWRTS